MNLQQKMELSQIYDKFIIKMKTLVLVVNQFLTVKPHIITLPSIYEAITTHESFQLYPRTLRCSTGTLSCIS